MSSVFRCRRCRGALFTHKSVLTSHGAAMFEESERESAPELPSDVTDGSHKSVCDERTTVWYLDTENNCPEWVNKCVNKGDWTKGKLLCPKCRGRLGSFDFTSCQSCHCGESESPPVHVNKNRVDFVLDKKACESKCASVKGYDIEQKALRKSDISCKRDHKDSKAVTKVEKCSKGQRNESQIVSKEVKLKSKGSNSAPSALGEETPVLRPVTLNDHPTCRTVSFQEVNLIENDPKFVEQVMDSITESQNAAGATTLDRSKIPAERGLRRSQSQTERNVGLSSSVEISAGGSAAMCSTLPANNNASEEVPQGNAPSFVSRRKRHKRVVSDCSWLRHPENLYFSEGPNTQSRASSSDDVRVRNHGNSKPVPMSTALLKKHYGHRRAQSMTVTSNRFEFLQEDSEVQAPHTSHDRRRLTRSLTEEPPESPVPDEFVCPVCLDLLCCPHSCLPCSHTFCESCLRQLARTQPDNTSCPMCRQVISQCKPQHHLSFLLKSRYHAQYSRRCKAVRKHAGRHHPLPRVKTNLRHQLGVVMQNRLRGRRLQEICRDHFIMTFFVYTGAVALLLGVFLLLILVCCKSLFFLLLLVQWFVFGLLHCAMSAGDFIWRLSPALLYQTTEAALANRVILGVGSLALVYKIWFGVYNRERGIHNNNTAWR